MLATTSVACVAHPIGYVNLDLEMDQYVESTKPADQAVF